MVKMLNYCVNCNAMTGDDRRGGCVRCGFLRPGMRCGHGDPPSPRATARQAQRVSQARGKFWFDRMRQEVK